MFIYAIFISVKMPAACLHPDIVMQLAVSQNEVICSRMEVTHFMTAHFLEARVLLL